MSAVMISPAEETEQYQKQQENVHRKVLLRKTGQ
jgi:hypothetical protein